MDEVAEEPAEGGMMTLPNVGKFNLPYFLLGPAGDAVSRILGSLIDVPIAKIEQWAGDIRSTTDARRVLKLKFADHVEEEVRHEPDVLASMEGDVLGRHARAHLRKRRIVAEALTMLEATSKSKPQGETRTLDEDWLEEFDGVAGKTTTVERQDLWARVLANELRKPGSLSRRAMRIVNELDAEVAKQFELFCSMADAEGIVYKLKGHTSPISLRDLIALEETGLINGSAGVFKRGKVAGPAKSYTADFTDFVLMAAFEAEKNVSITAYSLTVAGTEIRALFPRDTNHEYLNALASELFVGFGANWVGRCNVDVDAGGNRVVGKVIFETYVKPV